MFGECFFKHFRSLPMFRSRSANLRQIEFQRLQKKRCYFLLIFITGLFMSQNYFVAQPTKFVH